MHVFHIHYRNTQGTLMRILTAASRRGIELPYVQAEPAEHAHKVTLLLAVNSKQVGQLCRDWHAIVDVSDVGLGTINDFDQHIAWTLPHPTASAGVPDKAAARPASA
jgi:acetolactate synthase regulatory subunit